MRTHIFEHTRDKYTHTVNHNVCVHACAYRSYITLFCMKIIHRKQAYILAQKKNSVHGYKYREIIRIKGMVTDKICPSRDRLGRKPFKISIVKNSEVLIVLCFRVMFF